MQNEGVVNVAPNVKQLTPDSGLEWSRGSGASRWSQGRIARARALQTGAGGLGLVLLSCSNRAPAERGKLAEKEG